MPRSFQQFVEGPEPRDSLQRALWFASRGEWEQAHTLVAAEDSREAAWLHAVLHRQEGDDLNAGYWYSRSGRSAADGSIEDELALLVAELTA